MPTAAATFIGNITQDPELRVVSNGRGKLSFSIACSHMWTDQAGEKQEKTSFFNVVAWGQSAEDAAAVLEKGMRVLVSGRLEQRTYVDKEGSNRSLIELVADEIAVSTKGITAVTRKQRSGDGAAAQKPQRRQTAQTRIVEDDEPF